MSTQVKGGGSTIGTYSYTFYVQNENYSVNKVLDSLSSSVSSVQNLPSWLSVSEAEKDAAGHTVITLTVRKNSDAEEMTTANAVIGMTDGSTVNLKVVQGIDGNENGLNASKNRANQEFIDDWENCEEVDLHGGGTAPTPWASPTISNIPREVAKDVKKSHGWQMAFSTVGKVSKYWNYFGLYNKYTGVLRIFYYVNESVTGTGNDAYFLWANSGIRGTCKQPYYHTLAYGIPYGVDHNKIDGSVDVAQTNTRSTFTAACTPYYSIEVGNSRALAQGWFCFDVDMSAYSTRTAGVDFNPEDQIVLQCRTNNVSQVELFSDMSAAIDGTFSDEHVETTNSAEGISSFLHSAADILGGTSASSLANIEQVLTGGSMNYYKLAASSFFSIAAGLVDHFSDTQIDTIPGKIQLNLTGTLTTNGKITDKDIANDVPPLEYDSGDIKDTFKSDLFKGVWNIEDFPKVYVVTDMCYGEDYQMTLVSKGGNAYGAGVDADARGLKMITFYDPGSIRIKLNADLYSSVKDIQVTSFYGVYTDKTAGITSPYRKMMGLSDDAIRIDPVTNPSNNTLYNLGSNGTMKYFNIYEKNLINKAIGESLDECKLVGQKDDNNVYGGQVPHYFGMPAKQEGNINAAFMIDPMVYFPYGDTRIYSGFVPKDFVVCVNLKFTTDEGDVILTKRFLPEIVKISSSELQEMYEHLYHYSARSKNGVPIYRVNGAGPVYDPLANITLVRTLKLLKACGFKDPADEPSSSQSDLAGFTREEKDWWNY